MIDWIPTSDSLPPFGEYVLVWCPGQPWVSKSETVFAKVMLRKEYDPKDCRAPGWYWQEFGPLQMRDGEVQFWAPITHPDDY